MRFFQPLGLLALIAVPIIIIMYILKQKHKEKLVPSIYLWKKAAPRSKAQEPWQKLRKNRLMFLQILGAVLLALALSGVYYSGHGQVNDYIFALDCSLSMQAKNTDGKTGFEAAKEEIKTQIENAPPNATFSLALLDSEPSLVLSGSAQKQQALNALENAVATDGGVDWEKAKEILSAQAEALGGSILLFSDNYSNLGDLSPQEYVFRSDGSNSAVTMLAYSSQEDGISVLASVKAWSEGEKTLTLFADGVAYDAKSFEISAGEQRDITFRGVPSETKNIMVRLSPDDSLEADNVRQLVTGSTETKRALLVTEGNIFLEKALSLMEQTELYQATPDRVQNLSGYDLYIFDGYLPNEMPEDGYYMIFDPPAGGFISMGEEKTVDTNVKTAANTGLEDIEALSFDVEKARPLDALWGRSIFRAGEDTIGAYGEINGRKTAVFSFDLNASDLPLTGEFPILMYRLTEWFFPDEGSQMSQYSGGEAVSFSLQPQTQRAYVILPDGDEAQIAPPFPAAAFTKTQKAGLYTLVEESSEGVTQRAFAVNPDSLAESDLTLKGEATETEEAAARTIEMGKPFRNALLLLFCAALIIEWRVSCGRN